MPEAHRTDDDDMFASPLHSIVDMPVPRTSIDRRSVRTIRAEDVFRVHGGVASRRALVSVGLSQSDIRSEIRSGRWSRGGWHTVIRGTEITQQAGRHWRAVWESGSGAVIDGASALCVAGLTGFRPDMIDISLPHNCHVRPVEGVRVHRRRRLPPLMGGGIPRARPDHAAIRAAQLAVSDRQAALILCLAVQQRLVRRAGLLEAWSAVERSPRRAFLAQTIRDICDGAHSLGEIDFAVECRRAGLPEPSRQCVLQLPGGRVYLDVEWSGVGLVVEIDGGHHGMALTPVADALRQNELTLLDKRVLRIPLLGWRLNQPEFMVQVIRGYGVAAAARGQAIASRHL